MVVPQVPVKLLRQGDVLLDQLLRTIHDVVKAQIMPEHK